MTHARALVAGLLAGLLAGVVLFAFHRFVTEQFIDDAIAIEEASAPHSTGHEEAPLVDRPTQRGIGLFTATALAGMAFGAIFGLVFASLRRSHTALRRAWLLATGLWAAGVMLPWLKYPPNPPAIGDPDTITGRTFWFLAVIVAGLLIWWGAVRLRILLEGRHVDPLRRDLAVAGSVVAALLVVLLAFPAMASEIPAAFGADLLWKFRLASLAANTILWAVIGTAVGVVASRTEARAPETDGQVSISA